MLRPIQHDDHLWIADVTEWTAGHEQDQVCGVRFNNVDTNDLITVRIIAETPLELSDRELIALLTASLRARQLLDGRMGACALA
jgi:hypothetical protein